MKRLTHLLLLAALVLVAPGCSLFGSSGNDQEPSVAMAPGAMKDPTRQGPAVPVEGATDGGTITVLLPGDRGPATLDPTAGWSVVGNSILQSLTHRSLTQYVVGEQGQAVLVPDLATDLGRPDETFTQWRFTIREGATWQDGSEVTPEQVAFGITRSFDDVHFPDGPGTQYTRHFFAGADHYRGPYEDADTAFDGVRVEGRDVVIDMARPFPGMDHWGAFMAMGPAPVGDAAEPPAYGNAPLATGPYVVESFVPGDRLTLVRNEEWRPESDPGRHQYVDRWVFRFDHDQQAADDLVLSDRPRAATTVVHRVSADRLAEADRILGDHLVQQQQPCVSMLAPDTRRLTDVRVRRALAHSFDHLAVWATNGDVPGVTRTPANSLLVPGVPSRSEHSADGEEFTYDPERARALLLEAGHEPGDFSLTMAVPEGDQQAAAVQAAMTRGFEAGGFTVNVLEVEGPLHEVYGKPRHPINRRLDVRHLNWCADWPSAATMLPYVLGSGQRHNFSHFSEPEVDAEMARVETLPLQEQAAAWGALADRVQQDHLPVIPTSYSITLAAFGKDIGNPSGEAATGAVNYKDLFVAR